MWRTKWLILWSLWAARLVRQPTAPVLTSSGWVRGSVAHAGTHAHYLAIPYATVTDRFQAPGPEPTWDTTFEAINENIRCIQTTNRNSNTTMGQEDCLILNIYTPLNTQSKPLPVMVFIHGGGFNQHFSSRVIYGPDYLVTKDVILVTLNYRLGVHGFLCLGIREAPGNAGMKDQVAALRWVQKNIRAFGGDPDNVTIFGESAGGASVSYHIASPMSKGLFHKAIAQSGSSLSAWAFQHEPLQLASELAKIMGLESKDPYELYKFFMSKSASDLVVNKVPRREGSTFLFELLFVPCAESTSNLEQEKVFLTNSPYNVLTSGNFNKVPTMLGASPEEGLLFLAIDDKDQIENIKIENSLPSDLDFPTDEIRKDVATKVKELYMDSEEISVENMDKLSKIAGEPLINYPLIEETLMLMKNSDYPLYHYLFAYNGRRNIVSRWMLGNKKPSSATHVDELFYLFSQQLIPTLFEKEMINIMTTMWTNFAKYGNPTPSVSESRMIWPAVTQEKQRAFVIDQQFSTVPLWYNDSLLFWRTVYSKFRRKL